MRTDQNDRAKRILQKMCIHQHTHAVRSQISASSVSGGVKLPPISEGQKNSQSNEGTAEEGEGGKAKDSRPSPRPSLSWTPGVNEASAKRIREKVLLSLERERKQSRSLSLGNRAVITHRRS